MSEKKIATNPPALFDSVFSLKSAFLEEYESFADKRVKRIENAQRFIVDDRTKGDLASNGQLYSYFCGIFADVISDNEVKVTVWGNVPHGPKVAEWIERNKPTRPHGTWLEFPVRRGEQKMLGELGSAMLAIVKRGARYDTPNYKYVCPRTAYSLDRLEKVLDKAWKPKSA